MRLFGHWLLKVDGFEWEAGVVMDECGLNAVGGPVSESYGAICPCSIPPVAYICSKVAHTYAYMVTLWS